MFERLPGGNFSSKRTDLIQLRTLCAGRSSACGVRPPYKFFKTPPYVNIVDLTLVSSAMLTCGAFANNALSCRGVRLA